MDGASLGNLLLGLLNAGVAAYLLIYRTKRRDTQTDAATAKKAQKEEAAARKEEIREEVARRTEELRRNLDLMHTDNVELARELDVERKQCAEDRARAARDRERLARLEAWRDWMEVAMRDKGIRFPAFDPGASATMPALPPEPPEKQP